MLRFLEMDEYVKLVVDTLEFLPPEMIVHRLTGDAPRDLLIGPTWSLKKWEVLNAFDDELRRRGTWQGRLWNPQAAPLTTTESVRPALTKPAKKMSAARYAELMKAAAEQSDASQPLLRRSTDMGFLSVISMTHAWVRERVQPGDAVVDATLGGGVDARFLAELVGPRGTLIGFDIQQEAIQRTEERLAPLSEAGRMPNVQLLLRSHSELQSAVPAELHGRLAAVMFNLGYLPGVDSEANRSIITQTQTTLAAMESALRLLRPGGIIAAVLYPCHPGGDEEADAVLEWASALPAVSAQSVVYRMAQKPSAPFALGIQAR